MLAKKAPSDSCWSSPEVVARFAVSPGNEILLQYARNELLRSTGNRLLDIGCGAGSNAVPLAEIGWKVLGLDLSVPMLEAANRRARECKLTECLQFGHAAMEQLPVEDQTCDFIVAHGIWNLARSAVEFRQALREAARVARQHTPLFVYTFSRSTLAKESHPIPGESFIFTEFSGRPQCFLTETQLTEELETVGFTQESSMPITEYPRPANWTKPAILEGIFRRRIP